MKQVYVTKCILVTHTFTHMHPLGYRDMLTLRVNIRYIHTNNTHVSTYASYSIHIGIFTHLGV